MDRNEAMIAGFVGDGLSLREMSREQAAHEEEHRIRRRENADLQRRIWPCSNRTVLYSGCSHTALGEQPAIPENFVPLEDIAWLCRHGQVFVGAPSDTIAPGLLVWTTGSLLSNRLVRAWDRHDSTLKREGKPMIGSFVNEVDPSRQVCVYINGMKVWEPARTIVRKRSREEDIIFQPELKNGVPQQDAIVLKVVRTRGNAPALSTVEGWGPAGTSGFGMCLEDRSILSHLAKFEADSFEVVVIMGIQAKEVDGRITMTAKGLLDIIGPKPIQIDPEEEAEIFAAFKRIPSEPLTALTTNQIYFRSLVYRGYLI